MAEIQKIGHWFFGADRVATICDINADGLFLWATPIPLIDGSGEEMGMERLMEELNPEDMSNSCVSVELSKGANIVCDIPDNFALFIGDADGGTSDFEDEEVIVHWSKR